MPAPSGLLPVRPETVRVPVKGGRIAGIGRRRRVPVAQRHTVIAKRYRPSSRRLTRIGEAKFRVMAGRASLASVLRQVSIEKQSPAQGFLAFEYGLILRRGSSRKTCKKHQKRENRSGGATVSGVSHVIPFRHPGKRIRPSRFDRNGAICLLSIMPLIIDCVDRDQTLYEIFENPLRGVSTASQRSSRPCPSGPPCSTAGTPAPPAEYAGRIPSGQDNDAEDWSSTS